MSEFEELTNLSERAVEKLQARGASDATAHAHLGTTRQVKFANNKLANHSTWSTAGISLFAVFRKRIVSTTVREHTVEKVDEAVNTLEKLSKAAAPNKEFEGLAKGPFKLGKEANYDKKLEEPGELGVEMVERAVEAARKEGAQRTAGVLELSAGKEFLATNHGARLETKGSGVYFSIRAMAEGEASGAQALCSRTLKALPLEKAATRAGELAKMAEKKAQAEPGVHETVWEPLALAALLNNVGSSASIFSVEAGFSFLTGKIGKEIASKQVTFLDDAAQKEGYGSTPFDEEGTATRETKIIEKGVLKTYLHNHSTAKRHKTKSTGHAGLISPHAWNLVLEPGKGTEEKMIREMERGLLVTNIWYTRFQNYLTGDFSTIPRDGLFLVENGEIQGAVGGLRVTDNLERFLKGISAVGKTAQNVKSWEAETPTLTPAARVETVRFTASTS